jgi:hypothetical protein
MALLGGGELQGFWLACVRAGEVEEAELEDLNELGR